MPELRKKETYLTGAAILAATVAITKIIGALYKIPLYNLLEDEGTGHFNKTYEVYNLMLAIATSGVPVALSRLISAARGSGRYAQSRRYYTVGMWMFVIIGILGSAAMFAFSRPLAIAMGDTQIDTAVKILAPAVLFGAVVSVLRGYSQGHNDMLPTSLSQIVEVVCKMAVGLALAWFLTLQGSDLAAVAAGAIVGVAVGMGLSIPVMLIYNRRIARRDAEIVIRDTPLTTEATAWEIFRVSLPITLGAAAIALITLVDSGVISHALQDVLGYSEDAATALYGVYSKALALFNLPAAFITPVSVAVVPIIAAAIVSGGFSDARSTVESSVRLTNLLAMPAAVGLCVLSDPIFRAVYGATDGLGPNILAIMGVASYFVCLYIITNGILQASGHEIIAAVSILVGGAVKILLSWFLVSNPTLNIMGAPIGTLCCYALIAGINVLVMRLRLPEKPSLIRITFRPAVCTAVMGASAWAVYGLLDRFLLPHLGGGRMGIILCLAVTIVIAMSIYFTLVIAFRVISREDVVLLPKGEKIANLLRLK